MTTANKTCSCTQEDTEDLYKQIDNVIDDYKDKEGSLIQILHMAQGIYGHLPLELQEYISQKTNVPLSEITGVVSFYSFFSTVPRGDHTIRVCMGTACYVRGSKKILDQLQINLGIGVGETTSDRKFSLEVARCIGACGLAPAMMIDDVVYKQVNANKLNRIINEY